MRQKTQPKGIKSLLKDESDKNNFVQDKNIFLTSQGR